MLAGRFDVITGGRGPARGVPTGVGGRSIVGLGDGAEVASGVIRGVIVGLGLGRGVCVGDGERIFAFKFVLMLKFALVLKFAFVLKLKFESNPILLFRFVFMFVFGALRLTLFATCGSP